MAEIAKAFLTAIVTEDGEKLDGGRMHGDDVTEERKDRGRMTGIQQQP